MARHLPLWVSSMPDRSRRRGQEHAQALAGMLLAASIAALLVVADEVIESWTDGQLLAGWVALWTFAFTALALLAVPLRKWSAALAARLARPAAGARFVAAASEKTAARAGAEPPGGPASGAQK